VNAGFATDRCGKLSAEGGDRGVRGAERPCVGTLDRDRALVLLAFAACSEERRTAARPTTSTADVARASTSTSTTPPAPPKKPFTQSIWRSHYDSWLGDTRFKMAEAGLAMNNRTIMRQIRRDGLKEWNAGLLDGYLDALATCNGLHDNLRPAPKRVFATMRFLRKACASLRRGAAFARRGIEREDRVLVKRSALAWRAASNAIQLGNAKLRTPDALGALPLPVIAGPSSVSHIDPLFTHVGRLIASGSTDTFRARCWSEPDWELVEREVAGNKGLAGFASVGLDSVNLSPKTCADLARFAYRGERPTGFDQLDLAFAILVLMHETSHILNAGVHPDATEEQTAECWGIQHIRDAALELGADKAYSSELADRFWTEIYPQEDSKYRSAACRDEGALDVRRKSHVWP
jgi:hypothetical protein